MIDPPTSPLDVGRWMLALSVIYLVFRGTVSYNRKAALWHSAFVFDALLFATSVMLLVGVWFPATLKALGDLTIYLVLAGMSGIGSSLGSALKKDGVAVPAHAPEPPDFKHLVPREELIEIVKEANPLHDAVEDDVENE
ncbi:MULTISPECIES: hypothetical protein [unclassified Mesorhizobium]|uniref:hypothetical protein n=1 Tax=unclassified Mesorhizobium TaxID=325217 RepID=UPI003334C3FD